MNMQPPKPMKPQGGALRTTDPQLGHETSDISITGVAAFVIALGFCGIVLFVVLWGVYSFGSYYAHKQDEQDLRDPFIRAAHQQEMEQAKKMRAPMNRSEEPDAMAMVDAESRVIVSRMPQPRVQTDDVRDLAIMREAEDVYLNNYFTIDKNSGRVNIPIEQAMKMVLQKGLPSQAATPGAPQPGNADTTGIVRPSIGSSHAKARPALPITP
jgi:hypothetical protein